MLNPGCLYHIYNCSNGDENLFREDKNYYFFLEKYFKYTHQIADTYAFCLLENHFHVIIRIKTIKQILIDLDLDTKKSITGSDVRKLIKNRFKNFFISYAKAYNNIYNRRGSLFKPNMKKNEIDDLSYLKQLILYIHNNPVKHGYVGNLYDWPYSSIHLYKKSNKDYYDGLNKYYPFIGTEQMYNWFGGKTHFFKIHGEDWTFRET